MKYILISHYKESERKFLSSVVEEEEKELRIKEHLNYGMVSAAVSVDEFFRGCTTLREKLEKLFNEADASIEGWDIVDNVLSIDVHWGDWKHDHAFIDHLIIGLFNAPLMSFDVTEEDGTDSYSATRFYNVEEVTA